MTDTSVLALTGYGPDTPPKITHASDAPTAVVDFETYSAADLKAVGAWVYAEHCSTDVVCLSYKLPGRRTMLWTPLYYVLWPDGIGAPDWVYPSDEFPQELTDFILAGGYLEAHNAGFERAIWRHVMIPKYAVVPCTRWKDTMAVCAYRALPLKLDLVGAAIGLKTRKDPRGKYLIQKLCQPQRATKKKPAYRCMDPALLLELFEYCVTDTDTEAELSESVGELTRSEYHIWILDQKINDRGVFIDEMAINAALCIVEKIEERMLRELDTITNHEVQSASELKKMLAWLHGQGCHLDNLTADTVTDFIDRWNAKGGDKDDPVYRVLYIRQTLSQTSTKKLYKFLEYKASDGRMHHLLQYHGTATGRFAGRGPQLHNMPRGDEGVLASGMDYLIELIEYGDIELLEALYKDPLDVIVSALRGMLIAKPVNTFYAADFSAIEARVLAWIAGEDWAVEAYRAIDRGEGYKGSDDMYCAVAAEIFGHPVTKKNNKTERGIGKICVGADTLVMTDHGVKCIIKVTTADKIWDGDEWVEHEGPVYQGERQTIKLVGVDITPDHEIQLSKQTSWKQAHELVLQENILCQALAYASESLPLLDVSLPEDICTSSSSAPVIENLTESSCRIWFQAKQRAAMLAQRSSPDTGENNTGGTQISFPTKPIVVDCLGVSPLASEDATIQRTRHGRTTASEECSCTTHGEKALKGAGSFLPISSLSMVGTAPNSISTEKTVTKDTSPETCASLPDQSTQKINVTSPISNIECESLKPVYDLVNAGPHHCFTIITERGPLIISNCVLAFGYGGGIGAWRKFDKSDKYADEEVDEYKVKWRKSNPRIVSFWFNIEDAAIRCVQTGKPQEYRGIVWEIVEDAAGKWLTCRLPSGRRQWYYSPFVETYESRFGLKTELRYMGKDSKKGGAWGVVTAWYGLLVENIVSGISRDLMVEAMIRLEAVGYTVVLTIHDEILSEVPKGFGNLEEFIRLMEIVPPWFEGFPLNAEGWTGDRFHK